MIFDLKIMFLAHQPVVDNLDNNCYNKVAMLDSANKANDDRRQQVIIVMDDDANLDNFHDKDHKDVDNIPSILDPQNSPYNVDNNDDPTEQMVAAEEIPMELVKFFDDLILSINYQKSMFSHLNLYPLMNECFDSLNHVLFDSIDFDFSVVVRELLKNIVTLLDVVENVCFSND
jgi:hypothetical protein